MKKITLLTLASIFISTFSFAQEKKKTVFGKEVELSPSGHIRCASSEYEEYLQQNNPKRFTDDQFENWLRPLVEQQKQLQLTSSQTGGIIYIPVVVHVIHNGDAYGVNENITDAQVQSQITVMNQDYRKILGTPGYNTNPVGADTQIEFVLAKVDPNGNPTNGIDRVNLCAASWSTTDIDGTVKPSTVWDATQYMNMWSVNFTDATLLGYAQFPDASGLGGLNASGGLASTDGVVANFSTFGSSALTSGNFAAPYDRGRTMTHEVGHFLGLRHIWGDNTSCTVNATDSNKDYCPDTPAAKSANFGCVVGTNTCTVAPGNDMIENYMDYTDDTCMSVFTNDQKTRITTIMNNAPRRSTLRTSVKDVAIPLFANDAEIKIENACAGGTTPTCTVPNPVLPNKIVSLYNRGTATLTAATISYNMDGGTNYTNNWTGSLAPNEFAYVTLNNTNVNGTLSASITNVNGGADARATNNTATKSFSGGAATSLANFTYTTFNFTLTGDNYASETSWNLKNSAGTTLYSGGSYTNGTTALVSNQVWSLPANGCYTFTINDAYGDGICCNYGNGSYIITTNSGATTVASGATFTTSDSRSFSNNALSNQSFEAFGDVYVFPNPSKSNFSIAIPNGIELPNKLSIRNNIGQLIESKKVNSIDDLTVNSSSYSAGIYFVTIENNTSKKTLQIIKE